MSENATDFDLGWHLTNGRHLADSGQQRERYRHHHGARLVRRRERLLAAGLFRNSGEPAVARKR